MEGIIKVTPEELISTAEEFSSTGSTVSNLTTSMTDLVNSLSSIWEGDASAAYQAKFNGLQDDIASLNRMIQEHASDLIEMGNTYRDADVANASNVGNLSDNVIL